MNETTQQTTEQEAAETKKQPASPVTINDRGLAPTDMNGLWRVAQMVACSGLAPKGMATPENIFVAMSHGLEIGLPPMQSLQKIAVINGRPCVWGDAMMGLVLASGLLEECSEYYEGEHGTDSYTAVCVVKRVGMEPATTKFSVADAVRAGLFGKDIWQKYPERMLKMRARAYGLRDRFADVLGGLYMAEELQGETDRVRVVDNTTGDDDLAAALTTPPALPEPDDTKDKLFVGEVVEPREVVTVNQTPDDVADDDKVPFDVDDISRRMDEEMGKKKNG